MTERNAYEISLFFAMVMVLFTVHPVVGLIGAAVFGPFVIGDKKRVASRLAVIIESFVGGSSVVMRSRRHDEMLDKAVAASMGGTIVVVSVVRIIGEFIW